MQVISHDTGPCASHRDQPPLHALRDPGTRAIAHAIMMDFNCEDACFRMLYDYGGEPLDYMRANTPTAQTGVLTDATVAGLTVHFHHQYHGNWNIWTRSLPGEAPVFKAYLNPWFDDFQRFCLRIGPALCDDHVVAFKTVTQRWMAVRPDKFMVYFTNADDRATWISKVHPLIKDLTPNPTPFTQYGTADGLITLAKDPEDRPHQSWRSTLLRGIAAQIVSAPHVTIKHIQNALLADGIDPTTWELLND